jgi:hypothetical protein
VQKHVNLVDLVKSFPTRGQAQIVEKEKKHYQGLPEDLTPIAGKVGASAAEK